MCVFKPWVPIDDLPERLYVDGFHDDVEGIRFILRGYDPTAPTLRLVFESPVGYRNINESYRSRIWASSYWGNGKPSLLTVEGSKWIEWLREEAAGLLIHEERLIHYAIYTDEDCFDVVTEFPPTVEWLNR